MKILPVGAELFHADGQTDMARLIVDFRNFANPPKNDALIFKMIFKNVTIFMRVRSKIAKSNF